MKIKLKKITADWRNVADVARTTIGLNEGDKEITSDYKRKLLLSEHSPIRLIRIQWKWTDLKYWVSVHFVRHWLGILHYVKTQRDDRTTLINQTHESRNDAAQSTPVIHECEANAQSIINISRKRCCFLASPETREAWIAFLESFKDKEPELYRVSVKECVYRGFCPEMKSCKYYTKMEYLDELVNYRKGINGN